MRCKAPFYAGDPFHPETFIVTDRCANEALGMAVRQNLVRELSETDTAAAPVCGVHRNSLQQFTAQYVRKGETGARLFPLRFEAITREPAQADERRAA